MQDEIEGGAFNLLRKPSNEKKVGPQKFKGFDMFLDELLFSPNDPRLDTLGNTERAFDEDFFELVR